MTGYIYTESLEASYTIISIVMTNPFCRLGIAANTSRKELQKMLDDAEHPPFIRPQPKFNIFGHSVHPGYNAECIHNILENPNDLESRILWFTNAKICNNLNPLDIVSISGNTLTHDIFIGTIYRQLIIDADFTDAKRWIRILRLVDTVMENRDRDLFDFFKCNIPEDEVQNYDPHTAAEIYRQTILDLFKPYPRNGAYKAFDKYLSILQEANVSFSLPIIQSLAEATVSVMKHDFEKINSIIEKIRNHVSEMCNDNPMSYELEEELEHLMKIFPPKNIRGIIKKLDEFEQNTQDIHETSKRTIKNITGILIECELYWDAGKYFSMMNPCWDEEDFKDIVRRGIKAKKPYLECFNIPTAYLTAEDCYNEGDRWDGTRMDKKQYFKWMKLAADKGDPGAMNNVGFAYATGYGVEIDMNAAITWYRKAADLGDADGCYNLGMKYYTGIAKPENGEDGKAAAKRLWIKSYTIDPEAGAESELTKYFPNWRSE